MKQLKIIGCVVAALIAIGVMANRKDIARYIRISNM
jgi:hypothetical protein